MPSHVRPPVFSYALLDERVEFISMAPILEVPGKLDKPIQELLCGFINEIAPKKPYSQLDLDIMTMRLDAHAEKLWNDGKITIISPFHCRDHATGDMIHTGEGENV